MSITSWIVGLVKVHDAAVGFIPEPTVKRQYIQRGRYVLQHNEGGQRVGYLLHGAMHCGRPVVVSQTVIDYDYTLRGYGQAVVHELIQRAEGAGATAIRVRCATDLDALAFWQSIGFTLRDTVPGGNARNRQIARLVYPLTLPLFGEPV